MPTIALPRSFEGRPATRQESSTATIAQSTTSESPVPRSPADDQRMAVLALSQMQASREAAPPEQRPVQVRIGRVEIRANQPVPPAPTRVQRADGGFASMHLARAWLSRSFY
jgi:hypothetical protein